MTMWKDFKEFAMRGNVLDMAVGVIVGAAFGKITTSLVNDILMPPLGLLIGKVNFANLCFDIQARRFVNLAAAKAAGATTINVGVFINTVLDFILVSFAVFMLIQVIQRIKKESLVAAVLASDTPPPPPPTTRECPYCCSTISMKAVRCPHCTSSLA